MLLRPKFLPVRCARLSLALTASSCGLKGPLYRPDEREERNRHARWRARPSAEEKTGRIELAAARHACRSGPTGRAAGPLMNARRKLVLVDGSGYLYRAFHALPPLANSRGEPTGAVLGVVNMLNKLCKDESPELIAVVFDAPGRTFRDDLFEEYKAQRTPMPDDLRSQLQPLLDCVEAMGLPLLRITGVEADDVIGTLAKQAAAQDMDVLISTGDKDIAQIVGERITLVNTMTDSRLDRDGVKNKFGVWPEQIMDYLALIGDSIDNIPGIDKVGPKTAAKWLNEYGTLDQLVANAAAIAGKVGENLRAGLQTLELSRKLATIDSNLELDCDLESLVRREPNKERLRELYTRLEFRQLLRADRRRCCSGNRASDGAARGGIGSRRGSTAGELRVDPHDGGSASAGSSGCKSAELIALHVEAVSLDYMEAEIVGIAFSIEPGSAAYVPLAHDYAGAPEQLSLDGGAAGAAAAARKRAAAEDRTSPQVRRARAQAQRHRAARHALRLDAGIVRVEQHRHAPRRRRGGPALSRLRSDPLRRPDRPRREADSLQPGRDRRRRRSTPRKTPTSSCSCMACCGRTSPACRRCARCTKRSSSRSCRCCSGWSRPAC